MYVMQRFFLEDIDFNVPECSVFCQSMAFHLVYYIIWRGLPLPSPTLYTYHKLWNSSKVRAKANLSYRLKCLQDTHCVVQQSNPILMLGRFNTKKSFRTLDNKKICRLVYPRFILECGIVELTQRKTCWRTLQSFHKRNKEG